MIDLDALKARLAEYDDARPRCQGKVARTINCAPDYLHSDDPTYPGYVLTTYSPCCRPDGHEGECRNSRLILGWPGFVAVSALVAEVERLREINDGFLLELGRQLALLRDQKRGEKEERAAVVAWLRSVGFVEEFRRPQNLGRLMSNIAADAIERGEHRPEEK